MDTDVGASSVHEPTRILESRRSDSPIRDVGEWVGAARPVTVVEDCSTHITLYSHPSTPLLSRGIDNRYSLELSERIDHSEET